MDTRNKYEGSGLTILDAVETLSSIADMDIDQVMNLVNHPELIDESQINLQRIVQWLHPGDMGATVESVRETFRVILHYLRNFYKKEYGYAQKPETTEKIKSIMVLVGEAAKKLDRYTELFQHHKTKSVTDLKEYHRLQEFYLSRIAHKVDESTLGKWLIALTKRMMVTEIPSQLKTKKVSLSQHIFVDMDSVKKDSEYELFFIRKEDGTRFFSPRLIRNIKLVCDFGESLTEVKEDDPLESVNLWKDHFYNSAASQIVQSVSSLLKVFYANPLKARSNDLGESLSKALIALMLCREPSTVLHDPTVKNSKNYFSDFLFFLRQALHTRTYQKLIAYPPASSDAEAQFFLELTHGLCRALQLQIQVDHDLFTQIINLVRESSQESSREHRQIETNRFIWNRLAGDYAAISRLLKRHSSGPLFKVLDILERGEYNFFDPLLLENIPYQLYAIYDDSRKIVNVHTPSPTYQEFINKANVTEEFKGFLRAMTNKNDNGHHLMINLQDRTSWKEHARSVAVEDLQELPEFANHLTVVTLTKDTEFYHQNAPYNTVNHADAFIKTFLDQLSSEGTGYYFPQELHKVLFPNFAKGVLNAIHRVFFSSKNVLSREQRMDFIEIFYFFLQLKLLEQIKPTSLSFTCKDGVDVGAVSSAEFFSFIKFLNLDPINSKDIDQLNFLLYGPSLLTRERILIPDRFSRFQSFIRTAELAKEAFEPSNFVKIVNEVFGHFYKSAITNATVSILEKEGAWLKAA